MGLKEKLFSNKEEVLEVEDFLKAMAIGAILLLLLSPLAIFMPVIGFSQFLMFVVIPYYAGYQAGKRTDHGNIAGFTLGVAWTAAEFMLLFMVGNQLAMTGRARVTTWFEVMLLVSVFAANTLSCWLGGKVGSRKRFHYRKMDLTDQ